MSSTYNFLNQKSQLSEQYQQQLAAIKAKNDAAQAKFKETFNTPLDVLGGGLTEQSVVPLLKSVLKSGGEKVAEKLGLSKDTIKTLSSKLDSLKASDLKNPKQALKKLLSGNETSEEKQSIKDALSKTFKSFKDAPEKTLQKLKDAPEDVISKFKDVIGKKGPLNKAQSTLKNLTGDTIDSLDDDIKAGLGKNPSFRDILSAKTRQEMRAGGRKGLKLGDDLTDSQVQGRPVQQMIINDDPIAKRGAELVQREKQVNTRIQNMNDADQQAARNTISEQQKILDFDPAKQGDANSILDAREANVSIKENVADSIDGGVKQTVPYVKPVVEDVSDDIGKQAVSDFKSTAKKALERVGEIDAEGGAGFDVGADILGAVVGIGTLIAGIFKHKKPPPSIQPQAVTSSLNIGLDTV
jgi:hypothetical protein